MRHLLLRKSVEVDSHFLACANIFGTCSRGETEFEFIYDACDLVLRERACQCSG